MENICCNKLPITRECITFEGYDMKRLHNIFPCVVVLVSLFLLAGCAGPSSVTYSVYDGGGLETSTETVEYDGRGGSRVVAENGLPLEDASGFKEDQNLMDYGLGRDFGLEEGHGLMP